MLGRCEDHQNLFFTLWLADPRTILQPSALRCSHRVKTRFFLCVSHLSKSQRRISPKADRLFFMSKSLSGYTKLQSPNREFKSERPSNKVKPPMPNEHIWRALEDKGHTVVSYNDGHMLRIDARLDIYPKHLKYRYTHSRNTPFRLVTDVSREYETLIQTIKRILSLAPEILLPRQAQRDNSPRISTGISRAVRRYKKSI